MKKILPILIVLIAVGGSGFAAMTIRGGPATAMAEGQDGAYAPGGVHSMEGQEEETETLAYFRFQRDFIVPVMRRSTVDSLILMSVNIEMPEAVTSDARVLEPRLRDAFMRSLLGLSHEGYFASDITAPTVYDEIQMRLTEAAQDIIGDDVRSVLIVDFARQDQ